MGNWASHRQRLKYETIRNDGKVKEEGARQCLEKRKRGCTIWCDLRNCRIFNHLTRTVVIFNAASLFSNRFLLLLFIPFTIVNIAYMSRKIFVYLFLFITLCTVVNALPHPNIDELITQDSNQEQASILYSFFLCLLIFA